MFLKKPVWLWRLWWESDWIGVMCNRALRNHNLPCTTASSSWQLNVTLMMRIPLDREGDFFYLYCTSPRDEGMLPFYWSSITFQKFCCQNSCSIFFAHHYTWKSPVDDRTNSSAGPIIVRDNNFIVIAILTIENTHHVGTIKDETSGWLQYTSLTPVFPPTTWHRVSEGLKQHSPIQMHAYEEGVHLL